MNRTQQKDRLRRVIQSRFKEPGVEQTLQRGGGGDAEATRPQNATIGEREGTRARLFFSKYVTWGGKVFSYRSRKGVEAIKEHRKGEWQLQGNA